MKNFQTGRRTKKTTRKRKEGTSLEVKTVEVWGGRGFGGIFLSPVTTLTTSQTVGALKLKF